MMMLRSSRVAVRSTATSSTKRFIHDGRSQKGFSVPSSSLKSGLDKKDGTTEELRMMEDDLSALNPNDKSHANFASKTGLNRVDDRSLHQKQVDATLEEGIDSPPFGAGNQGFKDSRRSGFDDIAPPKRTARFEDMFQVDESLKGDMDAASADRIRASLFPKETVNHFTKDLDVSQSKDPLKDAAGRIVNSVEHSRTARKAEQIGDFSHKREVSGSPNLPKVDESDSLTDKLRHGMEKVGEKITNAIPTENLEGLSNTKAGAAASQLGEKMTEGVHNLTEKAGQMKESLTGSFANATEMAKEKFNDVKEKVTDTIQEGHLVDTLKQSASSAAEAVKPAITTAAEKLREASKFAAEKIPPLAQNLKEKIPPMDTIKEKTSEALHSQPVEQIKDTASSLLNKAKSTLGDLIKGAAASGKKEEIGQEKLNDVPIEKELKEQRFSVQAEKPVREAKL
eukprot:TRINITY_DN1569_c0_g1_i1.p1 TRINITY_DN1569_c0_g1~~TRINITY_DN1569_c0_g1_i1.p1  ORF type:complete len:453 (+),score=152.18 TRINITY_DN1569_c0_g1_i1:103-1461(+)